MNLLGVADTNCIFAQLTWKPMDVKMIAVFLVTEILERRLVLVT